MIVLYFCCWTWIWGKQFLTFFWTQSFRYIMEWMKEYVNILGGVIQHYTSDMIHLQRIFQVVEQFCSRKGITAWTRIFYQVHNLYGFVEFRELAFNLESAWCLRLRLHAVFVRDIRDLLHLNLSNSYPYDLIPRLVGSLVKSD